MLLVKNLDYLPTNRIGQREGRGGGHNGTTWSAVGNLALRLLWAINTTRVGVWRVYKLAVNYRYAKCGAGAKLGLRCCSPTLVFILAKVDRK